MPNNQPQKKHKMKMKSLITIFCKNTGSYHEFPIGTSLIDIYRELKLSLPYRVVAAHVNYKIEDLNFLVYKPKDIEFIDVSSPAGMRVYVHTLCMVMAKAVSELYPGIQLHIEHPISKGYYCRLSNYDREITAGTIEEIKTRMLHIIAGKIPIDCKEWQTSGVVGQFEQENREDTVTLLKTLGNPYSRFFSIGDFDDYYNGVLMPSTDYLYLFDLLPFYDGMLLRVPNRSKPDELEEIVPQPKMFETFKEYVGCNKIMKISNVGELNIACENNQMFDLIKISEALHEKKVISIADTVCKNVDKIKFVLISGPSSSGKTTFSKRLSIQLAVAGLKPVALSLDNYFVNREDTPLDENGKWDFESLNALDLELFNRQIKQMLAGEEVELPSFNFETGKRHYRGDKLKLTGSSIIIMEGIHALNPDLLPNIPKHFMFKIYVSALTTISLDNHNWISTADTRLLRRIIRDHSFRKYSARETIGRWMSVRRGEDKWIFPFQEQADVMFNSALLFELAVLKKHVEPILAAVPKYCEEYTEAHRLLKFLDYFLSIPESEIPPTSLLREFVGGSSFRY
jgi:uridine kinase